MIEHKTGEHERGGERRGREEGRETGRERLLLATMLSRYINNPITGLTERASCRW